MKTRKATEAQVAELKRLAVEYSKLLPYYQRGHLNESGLERMRELRRAFGVFNYNEGMILNLARDAQEEAGCPTDGEMQAMFAAAEAEQTERDKYFMAHGMGRESDGWSTSREAVGWCDAGPGQ